MLFLFALWSERECETSATATLDYILQGCRIDKFEISPNSLKNFAKFRQALKSVFIYLTNILEKYENLVSKHYLVQV